MRAWLWPDHVIGKRESRRLREEHNALYNSHADLLEAAEGVERVWSEGDLAAATRLLCEAAKRARVVAGLNGPVPETVGEEVGR